MRERRSVHTLSLALIVSTRIYALMFPSSVTVGTDRILVADRDIERPTIGE